MNPNKNAALCMCGDSKQLNSQVHLPIFILLNKFDRCNKQNRRNGN